jgi:hypothetical protein
MLPAPDVPPAPPAEQAINGAGVALVGMDACKAVEPHRPSRTERRSKLIAAHVALDAVKFEIDTYPHLFEAQRAIEAAIGRLDLRD